MRTVQELLEELRMLPLETPVFVRVSESAGGRERVILQSLCTGIEWDRKRGAAAGVTLIGDVDEALEGE